MDVEELDRYLSRDEQWGAVLETPESGKYSWFLVRKRKVAIFAPYDPAIDPPDRKAEVEAREQQRQQVLLRPYHVLIIEIDQNEYHSGEEDLDYYADSYYLPTLQDVVALLTRYGSSLNNLRWRGDLVPRPP